MYKVELTPRDELYPSVYYFTDNLIVRTFKNSDGCSVYAQGSWWNVRETQEEVISRIDMAIQYFHEYKAKLGGY